MSRAAQPEMTPTAAANGAAGDGARGKSAAAFRTISEVARDLEIPAHVLRFWESKFAQISPVKRAGGRRYYRPEDVVLIERIRALLYRDGYTIKGVQKLISGAYDSAALQATPPSDRVGPGDRAAYLPVPAQGAATGAMVLFGAAAAPGPARPHRAKPAKRAGSASPSPELRLRLTAMLDELQEIRRLLSRAGRP